MKIQASKVRGSNAESGGFSDKPFMAVDRSGSVYDGNVYLSWTDMNGSNVIVFSRSVDGGASLSTPITLGSGSDAQGSFPVVACNGDVYVAWFSNSIKVRKSTDGGATFEPEKTVALSVTQPGNYYHWLDNTRIRNNAFPLMAAHPTDPSRIYITWAGNPPGSDDADVYFSTTQDAGNTWSAPIRVNGDTTTCDQFFPSVGVDADGNVAVIYYDRRYDPANTWIDLMVSLSTDDGNTFPYEEIINETSFRAVGDYYAGYAIGDYNHTTTTGKYFHTVWGDGKRLCIGEPDNDVYYAKFTAEDIMGTEIPISNSLFFIIIIMMLLSIYVFFQVAEKYF